MRSSFPQVWPVAAAASLFGMVLGAAFYATFGQIPTQWMTAAPRSEWLGFTGAVIGGVCTIGAGALAVIAVDFQIKETQRKAEENILAYVNALSNNCEEIINICKLILSKNSKFEEVNSAQIQLVNIREFAPVSPSKEEAVALFSSAGPDIVTVGRRCIEAERMLDAAMKTLPLLTALGPIDPHIRLKYLLIQNRAEITLSKTRHVKLDNY